MPGKGLDLPLEYLSDIGEVHLDAVFVLVVFNVQITKFTSLTQFVNRCDTVIYRTNVELLCLLSRSRGKLPKGV
jgi:hypothetical protein